MWIKVKMGSSWTEALFMGSLERWWQVKTISVGRSSVVYHVIHIEWKEKRPKVSICGIMGSDERPGQLVRGMNGKKFKIEDKKVWDIGI